MSPVQHWLVSRRNKTYFVGYGYENGIDKNELYVQTDVSIANQKPGKNQLSIKNRPEIKIITFDS
jgi:hypothetical protein